MRKYGDRKTHSGLPGHQECGICHPNIKNGRARARREAKRIIEGSSNGRTPDSDSGNEGPNPSPSSMVDPG